MVVVFDVLEVGGWGGGIWLFVFIGLVVIFLGEFVFVLVCSVW